MKKLLAKLQRVCIRPVSIRSSLMRSFIALIVLLSILLLTMTIALGYRSIRHLSRVYIGQTMKEVEMAVHNWAAPILNSQLMARNIIETGLIDPDNMEQMNVYFATFLRQISQLDGVVTGDEDGNSWVLKRDGDNWINRVVSQSELSDRAATLDSMECRLGET